MKQVNNLFTDNVIVTYPARRARVHVGQIVTVITGIDSGPYEGFVEIAEGGPLRADEFAPLGSLDADMAMRYGDVTPDEVAVAGRRP
jgi:hypothetical protein